jgi:hypothetical protein
MVNLLPIVLSLWRPSPLAPLPPIRPAAARLPKSKGRRNRRAERKNTRRRKAALKAKRRRQRRRAD